MQSIQLQNDSLVEIATFLIRRWSEKENVTIEISNNIETKTRLKENKVILTPLEKRIGSDFQKYRQFRTSSWYEAMKIKYSEKILSDDHAFGFILNAMETQRVEELGRKNLERNGRRDYFQLFIHVGSQTTTSYSLW